MRRCKHKFWAVVLALLLLAGQAFWLAPASADAASSFTASEAPSGVSVTGQTDPNQPVSLLISKGGQQRVYLDQVTSDSQGNFSFTAPLPAGSYAVAVGTASGEVLPSQPVTVVTGSGDEGNNGGNGAQPPQVNEATISITGYDGDAILAPTTVSWSGKATALSLLQSIASKKGIEVKTGAGGYVKSIDGLAEFDHGPQSGWIYRVNGKVPSAGASSCTIKDGDELEWIYTTSLGADEGASIPGEVTQAEADLADMVASVASHLKKNGPLSDWGALGLLVSGQSGAENYGATLAQAVRADDAQATRITDVERQVLVAAALGLNPATIEGQDLLKAIYDSERLTMQGTNGVAYGLIALDSVKADIPAKALWTRDKMVEWLLAEQKADGSWALTKDMSGDVDVTAITLTALAPYREEARVKIAVDKALSWLMGQQLPTGGFKSSGVENSESSSQVIIALCSLGISPEDARFEQSQGTLIKRWAAFQNKDGGFAHLLGKQSDIIATEQALMALAAWDKYQNGKGPVYSFAVKSRLAFDDAAHISSWARDAVARAAERGLVKGVSTNPPRFAPEQNVTRAELVTILGRMFPAATPVKAAPAFRDVAAGAWYHDSVKLAAACGWVNGNPDQTFAPQRGITRQELALILSRVDPSLPAGQEASFSDLGGCYPEARAAIARVAASGLMVGSGGRFNPQGTVTREMAAVVLVRLSEMTGK